MVFVQGVALRDFHDAVNSAPMNAGVSGECRNAATQKSGLIGKDGFCSRRSFTRFPRHGKHSTRECRRFRRVPQRCHTKIGLGRKGWFSIRFHAPPHAPTPPHRLYPRLNRPPACRPPSHAARRLLRCAARGIHLRCGDRASGVQSSSR